MDSEQEYKLSSVLYGHSMDVRSVDVNSDDCILSGSRDKTAKFWRPNGYVIDIVYGLRLIFSCCRFNAGFTDTATYKGHKSYVSTVCFLAATSENPNGLVVTGGNDSQICVFNPDVLEPLITAKAHANTGTKWISVENIVKPVSHDTIRN